MHRKSSLWMLVCVLCLAAGQAGGVIFEKLLPAPGFAEGWAMEEGIAVYNPDTIADYINGEAELYFPYGFQACLSATYMHNGDSEDTITADLYVMGSPLDAFGIYSNYRYTDSKTVPVGTGGHGDEYQLMFYQNQFFVRLSASGEPENNPPILLACAKAISKAIPGKPVSPAPLDLMAVKGLNPSSLKYIGESLLGYAFFPKGLIGEVDVGTERPARAFIVFETSPEAAATALAKYTAYLKEEGAAIDTISTAAGEVMATNDPLYKGAVVMQAGKHILGVIGLAEHDTGVPVLEALHKQVPKGE